MDRAVLATPMARVEKQGFSVLIKQNIYSWYSKHMYFEEKAFCSFLKNW